MIGLTMPINTDVQLLEPGDAIHLYEVDATHLDDLAGAKVTIRETFHHYLDAANFPEGNPQVSDQQWVISWFIEQKTDEDELQLEFQLSSPADLQGINVPTQQISSLCRWICMNQYRGEACGYIGTAPFTKQDEPTDDPEIGGRMGWKNAESCGFGLGRFCADPCVWASVCSTNCQDR